MIVLTLDTGLELGVLATSWDVLAFGEKVPNRAPPKGQPR